jgi:hypothetical protein
MQIEDYLRLGVGDAFWFFQIPFFDFATAFKRQMNAWINLSSSSDYFFLYTYITLSISVVLFDQM